jgi:hypothetical protein
MLVELVNARLLAHHEIEQRDDQDLNDADDEEDFPAGLFARSARRRRDARREQVLGNRWQRAHGFSLTANDVDACPARGGGALDVCHYSPRQVTRERALKSGGVVSLLIRAEAERGAIAHNPCPSTKLEAGARRVANNARS